ncbi:hypothetical protein HDU85_002456 [Gaertneriomyces sp. JEL0708]|nr:hypothetical protein HDU85_002456 [Gaertneriomyces sp. JEL0708]
MSVNGFAMDRSGSIYSTQLRHAEQQFLALAAETNDSNVDTPWILVASHPDPLIQVYKHQDADFCIKVIAELNCTPETAFDLLADIQRRKEWDELCEECGIVEVVNSSTKIQFLKTKGVWPASPRDTVVVSHIKTMNDGRYVNLSQSVEHPGYPPRETEGIVRMDAKITGQLVGPTPDNMPNMCRVVQVADGDLKGWIPKTVIGYVATKSVPNSFKRLDQLVRTLPPSNVSALLSAIPQEEQPAVEEHLESEPPIAEPVSPAREASVAYPSPMRRSVSRRARSRGLFARFRLVLKWWTPYMIFVLFVMKVYRQFVGRGRLGSGFIDY